MKFITLRLYGTGGRFVHVNVKEISSIEGQRSSTLVSMKNGKEFSVENSSHEIRDEIFKVFNGRVIPSTQQRKGKEIFVQ